MSEKKSQECHFRDYPKMSIRKKESCRGSLFQAALQCAENIPQWGERALHCAGDIPPMVERALHCAGDIPPLGERALHCAEDIPPMGERALHCAGDIPLMGERALHCAGDISALHKQALLYAITQNLGVVQYPIQVQCLAVRLMDILGLFPTLFP